MLLLTSALALTPTEVDDRLRSIDTLSLAPDLYRRVEEPLEFSDGVTNVRLESGAMIPVFSGRFAGEWDAKASALLRKLRQQDSDAVLPDEKQRGSRELVGFVWLEGEGRIEVDLPHRSDAQVFANHLVRGGGVPAADLTDLAAGKESVGGRATQGLFLSADPLMDTLFLGDADADPYEIIVYDTPDDLSGAQKLLTDRLALWEDSGVDWGARIAWDRVGAERGQVQPPGLLIDVQTDTRHHLVVNGPEGGNDRWLAHVRDDAGQYSTRWRNRVFAAGRDGAGRAISTRISGDLFPPTDPSDPTSQRLPPSAPERVNAVSRVLVEKASNGLELDVQQELVLTLKATADTAMVDLSLPRVEARDESFALEAVTIDGKTAVSSAQIGRRASRIVRKVKVKDGEGKETEVERVDGSRIRVVFPRLVRAGETVDVTLKWKDTWPYANAGVTCGAKRLSDTASGIQRFLPEIAGLTGGGPWTYTVTVGVPGDSKLRAVVSGKTAKVEEKEGWRMVTTTSTSNARWPSIAVGKYHFASDPAQKGMPAVNAHLLKAYPGQLEQMAPEARRVVSYLQGWLPPYPVEEIDIVEGPAGCGGFVWKAPHGMAELQRMWVSGDTGSTAASNKTPKLAQAVFSHEIAHQYWGQMAQPASLDDRWMVETFAEVYSCMYTAAAFKNEKLCAKRMDRKRMAAEVDRTADPRFSLSLSEAFNGPRKNQSVYGYGPFVMQEMLRSRIGNEAFFAALDVMLRDHPGEPLTQERLQAYLEAASGQDLGDFFSYWVDQGLVPAVRTKVEKVKGGVELTVNSDVPFGTFDVDVRVTERKKTETHRVVVVNGEGKVVLAGFKKPAIQVDPDKKTLLRKGR